MKKKYNKRYLRVFSRHPSHKAIRKAINPKRGVLVNTLACIRLGSTTPWNRGIEINTVDAVKKSSNKVKMKACFDELEVDTPEWWTSIAKIKEQDEIKFPILAKKIYGSRGKGMVKIDNQEQLDEFEAANKKGYYFEQYYNYTREYRLHVTEEGYFYSCRKMLKQDADEDTKWFRNDSNCVWYLEDNPAFDKPANWGQIEDHCVKALKSVGLDIGACDVRVTSKTDDDGNHKFKIIEINSAPSFGEVTAKKYAEVLPKIVKRKV